jgi:DNA topoisomerase-1
VRSLRELYMNSGKATKKDIMRGIESVAKQLGNTVAVCRKCYIHPAVLDAYRAGALNDTRNPAQRPRQSGALKKEEAAVVAILKGNGKRRDHLNDQNLDRRLRASIRRARKQRRASSPAAGARVLRSAS